MKKAKQANVLTDQAAAKKSKKRGWILFGVFAPLFLVSFPDLFSQTDLDSVDIGMTMFCGILTGLGIWKVICAMQTEHLQKKFRLFSGYFTHYPEKSIRGLCSKLDMNHKQTLKDLKEMCARGYFDGYIDYENDCLIFHGAGIDARSGDVVRCPGCGAKSRIQNTGDKCPYCDAPLHLSV